MIKNIWQQLQLIKDGWDGLTVVPDDLNSLGFPGLNKVDVSDALGGLIKILAVVSERDEFRPSPISMFNIQQNVVSINTYVTAHIPTNPAGHMPEMLRLLGVVETGIRNWFEESDKTSKRAASSLIEKLAEAYTRVDDAAKIREELRSYHVEAMEFASIAGAQVKILDELLKKATLNTEATQTDSTESEAALAQAQDDAKKIRDLTSELTALKGELEDNRIAQEALFDQLDGYQKKIGGLLGDANRVGLGAAFRSRKLELQDPMKWWLILFGFSIIGIVAMGVVYFAPILETGKLEQLPFRLALVSPLIWLGWFSAKHYGYTARLREDYAFKEASAMSFEGYKREASEAGVEMQEKLLDSSIKNFSDNPIRIYNGHENHASPLHEVLDRSMKDQKLMDSVKAFFSKVSG